MTVALSIGDVAVYGAAWTFALFLLGLVCFVASTLIERDRRKRRQALVEARRDRQREKRQADALRTWTDGNRPTHRRAS